MMLKAPPPDRHMQVTASKHTHTQKENARLCVFQDRLVYTDLQGRVTKFHTPASEAALGFEAKITAHSSPFTF